MQRTKDLHTQDDWGTVKNVERLLSARRRRSVKLRTNVLLQNDLMKAKAEIVTNIESRV